MNDVILIPLEPIAELFESVHQGKINFALVPKRNSIAGEYMETADGLRRYNVKQIYSMDLPISLALGIHPDGNEDEIADIMSKDTALMQCSNYLDRYFLHARRVETSSTAAAMKEIRDKRLLRAAAIGSKFGIERYGLKVVGDEIGNQKENYTTFILLEKIPDAK